MLALSSKTAMLSVKAGPSLVSPGLEGSAGQVCRNGRWLLRYTAASSARVNDIHCLHVCRGAQLSRSSLFQAMRKVKHLCPWLLYIFMRLVARLALLRSAVRNTVDTVNIPRHDVLHTAMGLDMCIMFMCVCMCHASHHSMALLPCNILVALWLLNSEHPL